MGGEWQRLALARQVQPLVAPLALPARVAAQLRQGKAFLLAHPYVLGTAALGLVVLRPRYVMRWAQRGLSVWRTWRSLRGMVPVLLASLLGR